MTVATLSRPLKVRQPSDCGTSWKLRAKRPPICSRVFGQRSHVYEALQGKRPISAEQARKLARMFSVKPGVFI